MGEKLQHLGPFSDWLPFSQREQPLYAGPGNGSLTVVQVRQILGTAADGAPVDARVEQSWQRDGVAGEEVSWSVGYGPRTHAWLLAPPPALAHGQAYLPSMITGSSNFSEKRRSLIGPVDLSRCSAITGASVMGTAPLPTSWLDAGSAC